MPMLPTIPVLMPVHQAKTFTLATDLDGTLIPIEKNRSEHKQALKTIRQKLEQDPTRGLLFVSGRSFQSIKKVMRKEHLPEPSIIVSDVGTNVYTKTTLGWVLSDLYVQHLASLIHPFDRNNVEKLLDPVEGLELQESQHQGDFKISYYTEDTLLNSQTSKVKCLLEAVKLPFQVVSSVDPFDKRGLIDVLPHSVNKFHSLEWLCSSGYLDRSSLIYAGDSGNDLEVFNSEIPSIVVGNTPKQTIDEIQTLKSESSVPVNYFSNELSTSGVVDGCRHFGWL